MKKRPDPAAACRCFTAEDALRYALAAYYAASADVEPPEGEPFIGAEGVPYAGPAEFVEFFLQQVSRRVYSRALRAGIDLNTGSIPCCPEALCDLLAHPDERFTAEEDDSLPLPENQGNNQLGSGERD